MHSFTKSLRYQYKDFIKVIELAPPAVDTDLQAPGLHTFGVKVDNFVNGTMPRIEQGELEVGYQMSDKARTANPEQLQMIFDQLNQ